VTWPLVYSRTEVSPLAFAPGPDVAFWHLADLRVMSGFGLERTS
jgi:hypothetical protein